MTADRTSPADLAITGGTLLTLDPEARVLDGSLIIRDGVITSIGGPAEGCATLDAVGCLVLPGFIQAHLHLGQTIFRGLAENRRLMPWLAERIWPLEAAHDDESAYWCGLLGAVECLLGGTTTIQDIGIGPGSHGLLEAIVDSGLRAFAGPCLMDEEQGMPPGLGGSTEDQLRSATDLAERFDGAEGRLRFSLNPRFLLSCSDALWAGVRELSDRRGWPVHTHALEQVEEGELVRAQRGCDEIEYFDAHGLLAVDLRIAHGVQLQPQHLERVRKHRFSVAHCPGSNLKLGSGIADIVGLRRAGIPVGIGADGAPCNNDLDVLEEIRLAALLQKLRHGPAAFTGLDALRLATSEGARALGLGAVTGSLEVGKAADVVVLDTGRPEWWPAQLLAEPEVLRLGADIHDQVTFVASRASVRHVLVGGRTLVESGQLIHLDPAEIRRRAAAELRRLLARARLDP